MGYYTEKALQLKEKRDKEKEELLQIIANTVENEYNKKVEVINNV